MSEETQNFDSDTSTESSAFLKLPTQTQGLIVGLVFVLVIVALVIVRGLAGGDDVEIELDTSLTEAA